MRSANGVVATWYLPRGRSRSTACGSTRATAPPSRMSRSSRSRQSRTRSSSWSMRPRAGRLRHPQTYRRRIMSKVLVLYYSSYGHIEAMANAVAEGAREAGAHVDIKRVPELVPEEIARKSHYKIDQAAPIAKVEDLAAYDAIIIGAGTRFGRLPSQMANFLDQAGGLWAHGALHGKVGGAFTSTATQHGGQEMTLFSIIANLLHFGMVIVGLDYGHSGQTRLEEVTGGTPYAATTDPGGRLSFRSMPRRRSRCHLAFSTQACLWICRRAARASLANRLRISSGTAERRQTSRAPRSPTSGGTWREPGVSCRHPRPTKLWARS